MTESKETLREYTYVRIRQSVYLCHTQNFRLSTSLFRNNPHEHAIGYKTEKFLEALLPGEINIKYESTEI